MDGSDPANGDFHFGFQEEKGEKGTKRYYHVGYPRNVVTWRLPLRRLSDIAAGRLQEALRELPQPQFALAFAALLSLP